jgi:hypothetical protein
MKVAEYNDIVERTCSLYNLLARELNEEDLMHLHFPLPNDSDVEDETESSISESQSEESSSSSCESDSGDEDEDFDVIWWLQSLPPNTTLEWEDPRVETQDRVIECMYVDVEIGDIILCTIWDSPSHDTITEITLNYDYEGRGWTIDGINKALSDHVQKHTGRDDISFIYKS